MRTSFRLYLLVIICAAALTGASAQLPVCPDRPRPGNFIENPVDLYSQNGSLTVDLKLQNMVDVYGFMHYCYTYIYQGQQIEAPTLRLNPGDRLTLNLTNNIQAPYDRSGKRPTHVHMHVTAPKKNGAPPDDCNGGDVLPSTSNIHFHGLNIPPVCHQDEVINTLIQSGSPAFQYSFEVPVNEPPGMYWYHPHVHGNTSRQVDGGASGALIVQGSNPFTQGLPERILIMREQSSQSPARDPDLNSQVTLNFEPALDHEGVPHIRMNAGTPEFWRFLNASTKQFTSLQLFYGQTQQQFQVLSIDGVQLQTPVNMDTLYIPPAGRVEFIVPALPENTPGYLATNGYDTGPVGDSNIAHLLARLTTVDGEHQQAQQVKRPAAKPPKQPLRFSGLGTQIPTAARALFFSEQNVASTGGTQFYLTLAGHQPRVFHMDDPPAITTNVGAVEDWTIENHSGEVHAFHIHQIHFLVLALNGVPLTNPYMADTIIVPNWSGNGPYPSVKLRMDFRDPEIAGTFVYHCHILDHEDGGMMAKIQVNPAN